MSFVDIFLNWAKYFHKRSIFILNQLLFHDIFIEHTYYTCNENVKMQVPKITNFPSKRISANCA